MEQHEKLSKHLSYVLRHRPESIGVSMDHAGWVNIDELITKSNNGLTRDVLFEIVKSDAKGRYAVSEDGLSIRANQGHSIDVEVGFKEAIPPIPLYHGTCEASIQMIMKKGLNKMRRHHVHLSAEYAKAIEVGKRHGKVVVLEIDTRQMVKDHIKFFISENGVWLVDEVLPKYITIMD